MVGLYYGNSFGTVKTVGYAAAADGSVPVRRIFYAACLALTVLPLTL